MHSELSIFFEHSPDLMCIANTDGYYERVNPQFRRLLGYTQAELTENPLITFVHPEDHASAVTQMEKLKSGEPVVNYSNRLRKKDGSDVWVEWTAVQHKGKIYGIARDVTERRKLIDDLRKEREKLLRLSRRYIFATESADIGVWHYSVSSGDLTWNDQMIKLYGTTNEKFKGTYEDWLVRVHAEDRAETSEAVARALEGEEKLDTSFRVVWDDGSIHYIKAFGNVERDESGQPIDMVGVNWDITKEKDLDLAKSNFISFASHQLRTPLTGIRWIADRLSEEDLTPEAKKYIEDIEESSLRLAKLVDTLLNLSRIEGGHVTVRPENFDLILFLDDYLEEAKLLMHRRELELKKDPYDIRQLDIVSDKYILRNIILSIFSNAIEYTPDRGTIRIGVEERDDDFILIIEDTGIGIPKKDQAHIFDQFSRGSNANDMKTDGSGLGMYIAKESVELLGGKIWFDSEICKGTTFYIQLPKKVKKP